MQPWDWHPLFVHFSFALLFTASLLFIASAYGRAQFWGQNCLIAARWMFWIGIASFLFTATAGLVAYIHVPNNNASTRLFIHDHMVVAAVTGVFYLTLAVLLWRRQRHFLPPTTIWTISLVLGLMLLGLTGYLGGKLVYKHGVGVMPLINRKIY